jgi:hypothetical protein
VLKSLQAYGAVYDYPGKGHDRLYLDNSNLFFGVLDGAGGDELSEAIVRALPSAIAQHSAIRGQSQTQFMTQVLATLDNLPERSQRRSTAALACIAELSETIEVTYAHAGDTSIYFWEMSAVSFTRIAHSPTTLIKTDGYTYIDTAEFMGAGRTPSQISQLIQQLVLPKTNAWILLGLTDGVQDDDGQGHSLASLEAIVRGNAPQDIPQALLDGVANKYDDASVFVLAFTPQA